MYAKDARSMTQDRQKLKDERQQQREEAWKKRYLNALKKCYRATKPHRAVRIEFVQAYQKKWGVFFFFFFFFLILTRFNTHYGPMRDSI